ncbi:acylneuraminate cytidylyltransferase family protein [Alphaproteobacteria bacterium]|nr:acylneuraminate cytidylyltransferase family protein [Alphaproteobacteria bacterium]
MEILGVIPARGGSKGIPNKNIIDLCGKPLIAWSIETGQKLMENGTLARCIVSTDSNKIARIAKENGGDVPFIRPLNASTDKSKSIEFVIHALSELEDERKFFDAVMILQPTNPIRNYKEISKIVDKFAVSGSESLISCYEEEYINELVMYKKNKDNTLSPLNINHNKGVRRQQHEKILIRNGSLYVTKKEYLVKTKNIVCDNPYMYKMEKIKSTAIDNLDDLKLIRMLLCK